MGVLFTKMQPALFYRMFEVNEEETRSILAVAALERAETLDRKFEREDYAIFEFSERIWPNPDSSK